MDIWTKIVPSAALVILIIYFVIEIFKNIDSVKAIFKMITNGMRKVESIFPIFHAYRRKKYNEKLINDDFIAWQYAVLRKIYAELAEEKRGEGAELTELNLGNEHNHKYEAINIRSKLLDYKFDGLCEKESLECKEIFKVKKLRTFRKMYDKAKIGEKFSDAKLARYHYKFSKKYFKMIKATVLFPDRVGFMLSSLNVSNGAMSVNSYSGSYFQNLMQSHILEYELYSVYLKLRKKGLTLSDIDRMDRKDVLARFRLRNHLHQYYIDTDGKESSILMNATERASLLGVQMLTRIKNKSGGYDVLMCRRSEKVAAKPNYFQFLPSGGFESFNDDVDIFAQKANYSVVKAVFRELLEECFNKEESSDQQNKESPESIYYTPAIQFLLEMLDNGSARFSFMGTSMSLVSLRQELCFVLTVDNPAFVQNMMSNYESVNALQFVDIDDISSGGYWQDFNNKSNLKYLNCTSAGLLQLYLSHTQNGILNEKAQ